MKFTTLSALTLAAAFAGVHAQSSSVSSPLPTSTAGLTPCILSCVTDAASANGCQGPTDFACVCTNLQFQQQARACLQDSCSQGEVQAAEALQSQQCAAASSAASSVASAASSQVSSASSAASDAASSLSSLISSASTALSSVRSDLSSSIASVTSAASQSVTDAAGGGNAAAALRVGFGGLVGLGVAMVGVVAGAALVL